MTAGSAPATTPPEGVLFYVVGAPAEGKHRLLREARSALAGDYRVVFAHRYVTRPVAAGRDDEIHLPDSEFLARVRHRLFSMHWERGGVRYGIGMEINYWLAVGLSVVVRGSRGYLPQALAAYPEMTVLWTGAGGEEGDPGSLRRARERQLRHRATCTRDHGTRSGTAVIYLDCNGALSRSKTELVSLLTAGPARPMA